MRAPWVGAAGFVVFADFVDRAGLGGVSVRLFGDAAVLAATAWHVGRERRRHARLESL